MRFRRSHPTTSVLQSAGREGVAAGALDEVHAQLDRLNEHAPEHPAVRRLTNSWNSARRAWLSMEVNAGRGYGSIAGKDDISTDLWSMAHWRRVG